MRRLLLSAAVLAISGLAGCSQSVAGQPDRPVDVVERALPTAGEIAQLLGVPVEADTAPMAGGIDTLRDAKDTVTPHDCIGITHAGYKQSYEGAPVRDTGRRQWVTPRTTGEKLSATVAIVELDSGGDAQSWYAKSVKQWHKCQGVTVTERIHALAFLQSVDQVSDSHGIVAAQIGLTTDDGLITPGTNWRALTATSRYLVDVEAFRIGGSAGASDPDTSAIARFVVGKIARTR